MTYRVFNIDLETDGEEVETPEELFFSYDEDLTEDQLVDRLADAVSDFTGWLVNSMSYETVKVFPNPTKS
jgi:hypothetical protein